MFRLFNLMVLCLALMSGSVQMAVARGQAIALTHGGSTIVICTGYGVMTVALDEHGNPVGPVHLCPDCLAGMAVYVTADGQAVVSFDPPLQTAQLVATLLHSRSAQLLVTRVRGPPVLG
jgi:hypothetical protein